MIKSSTLFPGLHQVKNQNNLEVFDTFLSQLKMPLTQSSVDVEAKVNVSYHYQNQVVYDQVIISMANAGYDRGNIRIRSGVTLNADTFQMTLKANECKYKIENAALVAESRSSKMGEFRVEFTEVHPSVN